MTANVSAALTYIPYLGWIVGVIFLLAEPYKNNKFIRFHAFQSIFFSIFCLLLHWMFGGFFFPLGWLIALPLYWLWRVIRLALIACWIFLMYKAYHNERFMLPVIGELAAKQAG